MSDDYMPKPEFERPRELKHISQSVGLKVVAVLCVLLSIPAVFLPGGIVVLALGLAGIIWGVSRCLDELVDIRHSLGAGDKQDDGGSGG